MVTAHKCSSGGDKDHQRLQVAGEDPNEEKKKKRKKSVNHWETHKQTLKDGD